MTTSVRPLLGNRGVSRALEIVLGKGWALNRYYERTRLQQPYVFLHLQTDDQVFVQEQCRCLDELFSPRNLG